MRTVDRIRHGNTNLWPLVAVLLAAGILRLGFSVARRLVAGRLSRHFPASSPRPARSRAGRASCHTIAGFASALTVSSKWRHGGRSLAA